jgi:hypothetical protein
MQVRRVHGLSGHRIVAIIAIITVTTIRVAAVATVVAAAVNITSSADVDIARRVALPLGVRRRRRRLRHLAKRANIAEFHGGAEICKFAHTGAVKQYIAALYIAVHNAMLMLQRRSRMNNVVSSCVCSVREQHDVESLHKGVTNTHQIFKARHDLAHVNARQIFVEVSKALDKRRERAARRILEENVDEFVVRADVTAEVLYNVRVRQQRQHAQLLLQRVHLGGTALKRHLFHCH